jgi:hypothetical protein
MSSLKAKIETQEDYFNSKTIIQLIKEWKGRILSGSDR